MKLTLIDIYVPKIEIGFELKLKLLGRKRSTAVAVSSNDLGLYIQELMHIVNIANFERS